MVSILIFVLAFTAQLVFGVKLGWFPSPVSKTAGPPLHLAGARARLRGVGVSRPINAHQPGREFRSDYVRTAIAKGLPRRRVVGRHTLRTSHSGRHVAGRRSRAADEWRHRHRGRLQPARYWAADLPCRRKPEGTIVVGISTALVLVFLFANLIVDILYGLLDPRIRYE